jgi:3-dehydroquinate synthetase
MGVTEPAVAKRIRDVVLGYGPLPTVDIGAKRVLKLLQSDKKTIDGVPHFILAKSMGKVEIVNSVAPANVVSAVAEIARLSRS